MAYGNTAQQIRRLQENLFSIRKIGCWTAEEFGNKIGVTKQTISNLENNKTPMNLTQYIAIRAVLDYETRTNEPRFAIIKNVLNELLDKDNELQGEDYKKFKDALAATSRSVSKDTDLKTLEAVFNGTFGAIGLTTGILLMGVTGALLGSAALSSAEWLVKALSKNK